MSVEERHARTRRFEKRFAAFIENEVKLEEVPIQAVIIAALGAAITCIAHLWGSRQSAVIVRAVLVEILENFEKEEKVNDNKN